MSTENEAGPNAVIAEMRRKLQVAEAEVKRLKPFEGEVARLTPYESQATQLATQVAEADAATSLLRATHGEDMTMTRMGLDDSGMLVARALHGAAGEGAGALSDWLGTLTAETAPKPMQPYFAAATAPAAAAAEPVVDAVAPVVPTPTARPGEHATTAAPTTSGITVEAIREARATAQRTNDWSAVKTMSAAVRAEVVNE